MSKSKLPQTVTAVTFSQFGMYEAGLEAELIDVFPATPEVPAHLMVRLGGMRTKVLAENWDINPKFLVAEVKK